MRPSCGVNAARSLRCLHAALAHAARFAVTATLLMWCAVPAFVHAQAAQSRRSEPDVLHAPPPTPELTELDAATATPAQGPEARSDPERASAHPAGSQTTAPAAAVNDKASHAITGASAAGAIAEPAGQDRAHADAAPAEPSTSQGKAPPAPPPPPAVDGDFAGPGASGAASAASTGPQEDFEPEPQVIAQHEEREYSVRVDLLNWLLLGRLSVELEAELWEFLSVQVTPVFVVAQSPIAINYAGLDDPLTQHSHGIGPLSGLSLGVAAWLWGKPFKGYVLRLELTNYGYSYRTADAAGEIDHVDFTERRAILFIGSHSRFGAFTFAGGFGLGYELHQVERCGLSIPASGDAVRARDSDCRGKQEIALDRTAQERADLNGPLHPVYFQARFSIGVVF